MADAVVEFLLDNLKQLLIYNADLISGVKEQVESLHRELSLMKAFLKDSKEKRSQYEYVRISGVKEQVESLHRELSLMNAFLKDSKEKRSQYEYVRVLVRQITDVAYEAEDIIDTFVVNMAMQKARSTMSRIVHVLDYPAKLRSVAKQIESIKGKVKEIYDKKMFGIEAQQGGEPSTKRSAQKRAPVVEEDNVVGFDEEAKTVVDRLTKGSEQLEIYKYNLTERLKGACMTGVQTFCISLILFSSSATVYLLISVLQDFINFSFLVFVLMFP
ncbi:unnamed protein product [Ilex paraguariensis]|uniref:Disease resistance N-terminal domain-containing protein n=1 Tax=Ilex paraguariensis TaxID=185542 RepID=A0ABC8RY69_9AQUA